VDNDGYIATNEHIVSGSDEVFVKLFDGTKIPATIIETDPKSDLALLKIEKQDSLTSVNFSDSDEFRVGDIVIAIGSLHETGEIVTTGIISSKNKETSTVNDDSLSAFIKTNISIGASSSGGPLFNLEGKIIGINTNLPQTDSEPNFGFAIPSNKLQEIVKKMRENGKVSKGEDGKVSKGKLGICVQQLTQELIEALSLIQEPATGIPTGTIIRYFGYTQKKKKTSKFKTGSSSSGDIFEIDSKTKSKATGADMFDF
jgi:serine protease Do